MTEPVCDRIPQASFQIGGFLEDYLRGIIEQWLLVAPRANPAMLEMFRDRDCSPLRDMVPWAGEFAGKYLTGAVQVLRLTGDHRLRTWLSKFVARLLSFQARDGYLGPWPKGCHLTNTRSDGKATWDTWGHYHAMLGLILWHEETGDEEALGGAQRIADLICRKYQHSESVCSHGRPPRLVDTPHTDKNLAPVHALCILYGKTGKQRYLDMALQIVAESAAEGKDGPLAGDYLRQALAGREFFEMPKPRWESLHSIMALAELFWITGDEQYSRAFEHLWWSMVKFDRHNDGGFTSGEKATGNPYDLGSIETCCTIAWIAMSVEMLKMTGSSIVVDEIELSTLNSVVGAHSHTGRWATYDTPMDGIRRASAHSIVFQAREGSPELNCCSVNSPRGFGMISDWALMRDREGLILNWYGQSIMTAAIRQGLNATLIQETEYPLSGRIGIRVVPSREEKFALKLRIPHWSRETKLWLNTEPISGVQPGAYLRLQRRWKKGDTITLDLDMSPHFWTGEGACEGLTSVYRGPLLLAFDHRYNLALSPEGEKRIRDYDEWKSETGHRHALKVPGLDAKHMGEQLVEWHDWIPPVLLLKFGAGEGRTSFCVILEVRARSALRMCLGCRSEMCPRRPHSHRRIRCAVCMSEVE